MRMKCLLAIVLSLAGVFIRANVVSAQTNATPRVIRVSGELKIGGTVEIEIENLSSWSAGNDPRKLVPYLNGQPLTGVYPEIIDASQNQLQFHLVRTAGASSVWATLFEHPGFQRPVAVSVGLEEQEPFPTVFDYEHPLSLTVIPKRSGFIALLVSVALFGLAIGLMIRTNMLRRPGPRLQDKKRPYDLGRFLTLFWSTIIAASYFSVWMITGDTDLPGTALALMGLSGSVIVAGYAHTRPDGSSDTANTAAQGSPSAGVLSDILSDSSGYRFHRFQLLLWNLLLGFIFVFLVWEQLALPRFSQSLLALLGISTAVHVGFNFLERPRRDISEGGQH